MVRRPHTSGWALTRQPAHAALAADVAAALALEPQGPAEGFAIAVRHHDDGWEERDREVRVGPAGAPETFLDLPFADHVAIARASVARATTLDPYAGALVARYAAFLHGGRPVEDGADRDLRDRATAAWEALAAGLVGDLASPGTIDHDLTLLAALDRISLWICGWPDDDRIEVALPDGATLVLGKRGDVVTATGRAMVEPGAITVTEEVVGDCAPFTVRERRRRTIAVVADDG